MKTLLKRSMCVGFALLLAAAPAVRAHEGHAGHHGWLAGASQPLLSWDHFLAAVFVVGVGSLGFALVGRVARRREIS
jgi:hydrogenase/urease accessory protein HupE